MNSETRDSRSPEEVARMRSYWRANLHLLGKLLVVWFVVSFVAGILLEDWLNGFTVLGFKLGFWFAQQGSIFTFVVLIFVYASRMKKLDRAFGVED
ncbi:DUF4212 domain-containing protein [Kordiimonas gwangyangensis]|uniref:DUF4212 domain-containing protein n=1 Tax=Kordiimonas gwangyangensis TaxID=288022 RepID=UPI0003A2E5EA|nr:DUF4212 domain-containing protein [Kordiimonas gwangyangensis]